MNKSGTVKFEGSCMNSLITPFYLDVDETKKNIKWVKVDTEQDGLISILVNKIMEDNPNILGIYSVIFDNRISIGRGEYTLVKIN